MLPTREEALYELETAGKMNPGPWVNHCAFRDQNVIRMISARLATAPEKARYEHGEDDDE